MSGISSGIGLISGIDSASLIDQLIALERRPIDTLEARVTVLDTQRAAFLEISAQLLAVQNSISNFGNRSFFRGFNAPSTDDSVLTATAGQSAVPGTFTFRVRSLVTNNSVISRGFADADTTPIGAGTISLEVGQGRVNRATDLSALNAGSGVRRGVITITDRAGGSADIDLSTALTIDDVLRAINASTKTNVRASVTGVASGGASGDRIVIEDLSDNTNLTGGERLTVTNKAGGSTATDLGIAGSVIGSRIDGRDLVRLTSSTQLDLLNDGNGVGGARAADDIEFQTTLGNFNVRLDGILATDLDTDLRRLNSGVGVRLGVIRITDRTGASADIDLTGARTVRNVLDAIEGAGLAVSATVTNSFFQINDTSATDDAIAKSLVVEDLSGFAAADLGIAETSEDGSIVGDSVFRIETLGDVINAINFASGNDGLVRAAIADDGKRIELTAIGLNNDVTVVALNGSTAAESLGLAGAKFGSSDGKAFASRRLVAGLNTVLLQSLNGGSGVETGTIQLSDRDGRTTQIDLSGAETMQDVIDLINADSATNFSASVNSANNGIVLRDASQSTNAPLVVEDLTGTLAADLGFAVVDDPANPFVGNVVNGGSAQLQYITRQTLLASLNNGAGVRFGSLRITDSHGGISAIDIPDSLTSLGEVIDRIDLLTPDTIQARINDTGDGIVVFDTSGGSGSLTIEDVDGSRTATDLGLAGSAKTGDTFVDGSFEVRIAVDADDTLNDIARKINDSGAGFRASVLNHGGAVNAFTLSIASEVSGRRGELTIDTVGVDLGLTTLSRAQDAVVSIGADASNNPLLVTGSSNTLEGVVPGVTLNLLSASEDPVTVTVAQDVDSMVGAIGSFVSSYNAVLGTLDQATSFDSDTLARGPLLGDGTVNQIRSRLRRVILQPFQGVDASFSRLFSVGIRFGAGGRLEFNEERFREQLDESPERVEELFTKEDTGFAAVVKSTLEELTRSFDGLVARKDQLLTNQQDLLNRRIDSLNVLLQGKRQRLQAQFVGLESSLANLQGQQSAISLLGRQAL